MINQSQVAKMTREEIDAAISELDNEYKRYTWYAREKLSSMLPYVVKRCGYSVQTITYDTIEIVKVDAETITLHHGIDKESGRHYMELRNMRQFQMIPFNGHDSDLYLKVLNALVNSKWVDDVEAFLRHVTMGLVSIHKDKAYLENIRLCRITEAERKKRMEESIKFHEPILEVLRNSDPDSYVCITTAYEHTPLIMYRCEAVGLVSNGKGEYVNSDRAAFTKKANNKIVHLRTLKMIDGGKFINRGTRYLS